MNKFIKLILFSFITYFNINAQEKRTSNKITSPEVKSPLLFKVGFMSTQVTNTINTTSKFGYQFGVLKEFNLTQDSYFQTGITYQVKGFNSGSRVVTLTYFEVPATWVSKINFIWLGAGVYVGLPIQTETAFTKTDIGFRGLVAIPLGQSKKTAISGELTYSILPIINYGSSRNFTLGLNLLQYF
jgi:hypothetical protein